MALYKLPNTEAFNGTLPMSAPIVPNEGYAKYVCLDPWINTLVTLASLGTIVTYIMVRCRKHTLCRGLEYATACHIYIFISRNDRYSPMREKSRLPSLMKGPDCTAHLMVLQGCTWYTVSTTLLHYLAIQRPFPPGSMNPLPPVMIVQCKERTTQTP